MISFNELIKKIRNNECNNEELQIFFSAVGFSERNYENELREFFEALAGNKTVTELTFTNIKLGQLYAKYIAECLSRNQNLRSLDLTGTNLGPEGAKLIAGGLKQNKGLRTLVLTRTYLCPLGAKEIADALKYNHHLDTIILTMNDLGNEGTKAIAEALKYNSSLTKIDLGMNDVENVGVRALALALKENQGLKHINLRANKIGHEGAHFLAEALKTNRTLTELDFHNNSIGDVGTQSIFYALADNQSMRSLTLTSNNIKRHGFKAIAIALRSLRNLQELYLDYNNLLSEDIQELTDGLKQNNSLTKLGLANILDSEDAKTFSEVLTTNQSLTSLDIETISPVGAAALAEALKQNRSLTRFTFSIAETDDDYFAKASAYPIVNEIQASIANNLSFKRQTRVSLLMAFHARSGKSILAQLPNPKDTPFARNFFGTLFAFLGCNAVPYNRQPFEKLRHNKDRQKEKDNTQEKSKDGAIVGGQTSLQMSNQPQMLTQFNERLRSMAAALDAVAPTLALPEPTVLTQTQSQGSAPK